MVVSKRLTGIMVALLLSVAFILTACSSDAEQKEDPAATDTDFESDLQTTISVTEFAEPETSVPADDDSIAWGIYATDNGLMVLGNQVGESYGMIFRIGGSGAYNDVILEKDILELVYDVEGDQITLEVYTIDDEYYTTAHYYIEDDRFYCDGELMWERVSNNTGDRYDVTGRWLYAGRKFELGGSGYIGYVFDGNELSLFSDNPCYSCWYDGSGRSVGTYEVVSLFDRPAIAFKDKYGLSAGTYSIDYWSNDLLMIYSCDDKSRGYIFYRIS